ncbi:MAG TPA: 2-keto-4-pentenoate hydratase [Baekduia sp.]|nr:2-keto-4-pentenoate hydratase [Baekduia sp.]
MTDTQTEIADLAEDLAGAERDRAPVAPLTERVPGLTVADAYEIQRRNVERRTQDGERLVGRKIGLTSKPMQQMLGVDEPDFGALLEGMRVEDGDAVAVETLIQPRIEAELAFVMGEDLRGPGVDALTVARAVAGVVPALEVIDSRVADWRIALADTVADNASSARYVLGATLTPIAGLDLRLLGVVLTRSGEVVSTGAGAAALGSPLRCVAWLANKLGEYGDGLRAGDVVLSGALHAAVDVAAGHVVRAEFSQLGAVTVRFTSSQGGDS